MTTEPEFYYGVSITRDGVTEALCVGKLPGRKRYALYRESPGMFTSLAYFTTEKEARDAARLIKALATGTYLDYLPKGNQ